MASEQEQLFTLYRDSVQQQKENHFQLSQQLKETEKLLVEQMTTMEDSICSKINFLEDIVADHTRIFRTVKIVSVWFLSIAGSGLVAWFLGFFKH